MWKTITLPQVAAIAVMLGFTFAAYKFLGEQAAVAVGSATVLVAFLQGRQSPPADGGQ